MLAFRFFGLSVVALALAACSCVDNRRPAASVQGHGALAARGCLSSPFDDAAQQRIAQRLRKPPKSFDNPSEAMRFYVMQRAPFGEPLPVEKYLEAQAHIEEMTAYRLRNQGPLAQGAGGPGGLETWLSIGPGNIGGRTRALVIHPGDHDIMYAGGVSGGIWKTTDGGASWYPLDDFLPNLAACSIAMDPTDPDVLYVGTGEGYYPVTGNNFQSFFLRGLGIFKTTDGGDTWTHLPNTINSDFYYVNDLKISSDNHLHIFAATWTGVWRSLDGGDTWTLVNSGAGNTLVGCTELALRTDTSPPTLFAAFGSFYPDGLYRSTDNGNTWSELQGGLPGPWQGRISLAIAPSNQDWIYACVAQNFNGGYGLGSLLNVYRSTDGGDTWEARVDKTQEIGKHLLSNPLVCICYTDSCYSQGWYDEAIAVDPVDPNIVWVGGVDVQRSDDGGVNWGLVSAWWIDPLTGQNFCHADIHRILFHPDYDGVTNQSLFVCSDGGIYRTDNARAATTTAICTWDPPSDVVFTNLNNGYSTIQFYHGDASTTSTRFVGGAQDNGTSMVDSLSAPDGWLRIFGGDGGYCAINPNNPDIMYVEYQEFPHIYKTTDGGNNFYEAINGITNDTGLFIAPFVLNHRNVTNLWTGGTRPWRTKNSAALWAEVGGDFSPGAHTSAIAIAPSAGRYVYFGFSDGYVHRSTDAMSDTPTWENISPPRGGNGYVSWITIHPTDPDTAYVTYSTFGGGKVFRTTDGGDSWVNLTGSGPTGLPNLPVHCLAINPRDTEILYVGTDLGVFVSEDSGENWTPDAVGMPYTTVENFVWQDDETLVAFTYGRSVFRTHVLTPGIGDLNCDDLVDGFDIDPFVLVLSATPPAYAEYYAQFPDCDHRRADVNQDGEVNGFDIDPFVDLVGGG